MRIEIRPRLKRLSVLLFTLSIIGACSVVPLTIDTKATAPMLDGFGETTLIPSQGNDSARRLFAQGMAQVYAFNPGEAIRAFKAGLAQDPDCVMCAWGIALQMGPNINNPRRGDLRQAIQYVDYAINRSKDASPRDRALIESLAVRYGHSAGKLVAPPAGTDGVCRTSGSGLIDPLDSAYAEQMLVLVKRFPGDPDVLAAYAEAEMVATRGDDWWDRNTGKPAGRIGEMSDLVEAGLVRDPNHVGLNHYMIHAVDAVPVASRAIAAADRLGKLAPKSPHLLHMPSHTYRLVGRYADATRVNQLAVAADVTMMAELKKQNFAITRDWRGHNTHFQWYSALMEGRGNLALETARTMPAIAKGDSEYAEYLRSITMLTLLHLQRWDELAKEPMPSGAQGYAQVLGEMARGIGHVRMGKLADAKAAYERLQPAAKKLLAKHTGKDYMARMGRSVAASSEAQLAAEIAFAEGRIDEALALQAKAVVAADASDRTEPPMLASGPRMRLGAMQLRAKRFAEAEKTYRDNLVLHPRSGWSLNGLEKALAGQGKQADVLKVQGELASTWALAEAPLRTIE